MEHYQITITAKISVLADNDQDAKMLAVRSMKDAQDMLPAEINFDYSAYLTPNQSAQVKSRAINA